MGGVSNRERVLGFHMCKPLSQSSLTLHNVSSDDPSSWITLARSVGGAMRSWEREARGVKTPVPCGKPSTVEQLQQCQPCDADLPEAVVGWCGQKQQMSWSNVELSVGLAPTGFSSWLFQPTPSSMLLQLACSGYPCWCDEPTRSHCHHSLTCYSLTCRQHHATQSSLVYVC